MSQPEEHKPRSHQAEPTARPGSRDDATSGFLRHRSVTPQFTGIPSTLRPAQNQRFALPGDTSPSKGFLILCPTGGGERPLIFKCPSSEVCGVPRGCAMKGPQVPPPAGHFLTSANASIPSINSSASPEQVTERSLRQAWACGNSCVTGRGRQGLQGQGDQGENSCSGWVFRHPQEAHLGSGDSEHKGVG